jgi:hypothetical protein
LQKILNYFSRPEATLFFLTTTSKISTHDIVHLRFLFLSEGERSRIEQVSVNPRHKLLAPTGTTFF